MDDTETKISPASCAARHEVTALSYDEARGLLQTAKGDRLYALWVVAISLGLRRSELLGLTWSGVDLDRKTLRVARGVQRVGGELVIGELKSERSHRTLPLPEVTADALRNHRTRQTQERLRAVYREPNELVFCTQFGGQIEPRNLNRSFRSLLIRSKVRVDIDSDAEGNVRYMTKLRLHDLRHSCASFLLAQGQSPRVVMEILGHSGIAITMNTYAHVLPTLLGDAATGMDEMFG